MQVLVLCVWLCECACKCTRRKACGLAIARAVLCESLCKCACGKVCGLARAEHRQVLIPHGVKRHPLGIGGVDGRSCGAWMCG